MNVLVTGGNGFVGKALVEKLQANNQLKIFSPSSKELNLMDFFQVEQFLLENEIEVVYHMAAKLGGVGLVMNKPKMFLEDNLLINYNIVKNCIEHGVQKFITVGSSCCYGDALPLPMKEDYFWKDKPENTYGICKLVLLEHLKAQDSMNWVYLVPPNIYGPGDHFNEEDAHFIPATVQKFENAVRDGKKFISVWGDGSQVRDFVYIDDLVNILYDACFSTCYDRDIINVATEVGASVKEIVLLLRSFLNLEDIQIEWDITKPTGTIKKILSNQKIKDKNPHVDFVLIEEGLQKTIDWYKKQK